MSKDLIPICLGCGRIKIHDQWKFDIGYHITTPSHCPRCLEEARALQKVYRIRAAQQAKAKERRRAKKRIRLDSTVHTASPEYPGPETSKDDSGCTAIPEHENKTDYAGKNREMLVRLISYGSALFWIGVLIFAFKGC